MRLKAACVLVSGGKNEDEHEAIVSVTAISTTGTKPEETQDRRFHFLYTKAQRRQHLQFETLHILEIT